MTTRTPNALPMREIPDGWWFHTLVACWDDERGKNGYQCMLLRSKPHGEAQAFAVTPLGSMRAAIRVARRKGDAAGALLDRVEHRAVSG